MQILSFSRRNALLGLLLCAPAAAQITQRVSVSDSGAESNRWSTALAITPDGRYVTFRSNADNLVPGDTHGFLDVFLRDRIRGSTEKVSVDSQGAQGEGDSDGGFLSPDARFVSFSSDASNLVPLDANFSRDAFLRDRSLATTELVSRSSAGVIGNGASIAGPVTPDGRYLCFTSSASNLVPGVPAGFSQIYVRDRANGTTQIVSVSSSGVAGNGMSQRCDLSDDGRFVAFVSTATNLVPGDSNGRSDVFVRDRATGATERISVSSAGAQGDGDSFEVAMSGDGRTLAFTSNSGNLVAGATSSVLQVYVRDRDLGVTELASVASNGHVGNSHCTSPGISDDGIFVAFTSSANNFVPGDTNAFDDVFLHDRRLATTARMSVSSAGAQGEFASFGAALSGGGDHVVFGSAAARLQPGDGNEYADAFVRDILGEPDFTSLCTPGTDGVRRCPCANALPQPDRGCDNSARTGGASLHASGGAIVSSDSLQFTTRGEFPSALSIVLQGDAEIPQGALYGQGVRCLGGSLQRLYTKPAVAGSITAPDFDAHDATVSARSAAMGDEILAGQSRWYLVYYRDPVAPGSCTANSLFNATQTGRVTWSP